MTTLQVLTLLLNKFRVSLAVTACPCCVGSGGGEGWGKPPWPLCRRSSKVSSTELESLGFEAESSGGGGGLGTCLCGTGCVVTARAPFLSFLPCVEKPWSDFLCLHVQVENGPSEFALYIAHESGGKCLPFLLAHKNKSLCLFGGLTDHAPSLRPHWLVRRAQGS